MNTKYLVAAAVLTAGLVAACSSKTKKSSDAPRVTDEQAPSAEIVLDQPMEFSGKLGAIAGLSGAEVNGLRKMFTLAVAEEAYLGLSEESSVAYCGEGIDLIGPEYTLRNAEGKIVVTTSALVSEPAPISAFDFPGQVAAGAYTVEVLFRSTAACDLLGASFKIVKESAPIDFGAWPVPPAGDDGATDGDTDGSTDGSTDGTVDGSDDGTDVPPPATFDSALVGRWGVDADDGFRLEYEFNADGTGKEILKQNGAVLNESSLGLVLDQSATPKRMMTVDADNTTQYCVYEAAAEQLLLDCSDTGYSADLDSAIPLAKIH